MLTLKKVKELVGAPSHAKRTPSPKMLYEEGIVLLRREFDQGSHLTVYNSGYVLFSAGKRNTVFHIHDCCGDYAYDAAEGKGDVIEEEYFENCEWHIRALFEGERKMEDNQAKCEGAGRSNVCVSYHALSEDWSEIADRTINMLEKIIENWRIGQWRIGGGCHLRQTRGTAAGRWLHAGSQPSMYEWNAECLQYFVCGGIPCSTGHGLQQSYYLHSGHGEWQLPESCRLHL